jgi:general secretion pathway protein A
MYQSYWQLQQRPFESGCDAAFYFPSESHQAALLKLRYAIENRRGAAVLAGPSGLGKTLLVQMLRQSLEAQSSPVVHLVFPQMSADELLAYLAAELDPTAPLSVDPKVHESVRCIARFLGENARQGQHAVVVIDEAHLVEDPQTLEALRLLLNYEAEGRPALTLLLVGQTAVLPTLDRMPGFEERLEVKCLLAPLDEEQTAQYVAHRLACAGARKAIFDPSVFPTLHGLTHGIPRRINRLCDLALFLGYAERHATLTSEHLESIAGELVAAVPA